MKQGFIPDSVTITRREDGAWDMVALFCLNGDATELRMIVADASFTLEAFFKQDRSRCPCDLCTYLPCRLTGYELVMKSALRPYVDGLEGVYLRQVTTDGGCDAA